MLNIKKKGFTIVEFVIIMAIIGILVLMGTPKFMNYVDKAYETTLKNDLKILSDTLLAKEADGIYLFANDTLDQDYLDFLIEREEIYSLDGLLEDRNTKLFYLKDNSIIEDYTDKDYSIYKDLNNNFYITENPNVEGYKPKITREKLSEEDIDDIEYDIKIIQEWLLKEKARIKKNNYTADYLPGIFVSNNIVQNYYNRFNLFHKKNDIVFSGRYLDVNSINNKLDGKKLKTKKGTFLWQHSVNDKSDKVFYLLDYKTRISDEGFYFLENTIMGLEESKKKETKDLIIPKTIKYQGETIKVENIGYKAFNNSKFDSITFKADLKTIDDYAFVNSNITNLKLPKSIEHINRSAFQNNRITNVNFEELTNLKDIGAFAFYNNRLTDVIFPKNLERILGSNTFGSNKIENLDLTKATKLKNINIFSFADNELLEVNIPKHITNISAGAFHNNNFISKDDIKFEDIDNIKISPYYKSPSGKINYTFSNKTGEHFIVK